MRYENAPLAQLKKLHCGGGFIASALVAFERT